YVPNGGREVATDAVAAFLDLMFEERSHRPLAAAQKDSERIQAEWFQHLMPDISADAVMAQLQDRRFVILQGPPGTGKTYMALGLLNDQYAGNGRTIQFHPNTTYEHFVGGLAPVQTSESLGLRFAPQMGYLMDAAQSARKQPAKP